jgi:hypothetical protein
MLPAWLVPLVVSMKPPAAMVIDSLASSSTVAPRLVMLLAVLTE